MDALLIQSLACTSSKNERKLFSSCVLSCVKPSNIGCPANFVYKPTIIWYYGEKSVFDLINYFLVRENNILVLPGGRGGGIFDFVVCTKPNYFTPIFYDIAPYRWLYASLYGALTNKLRLPERERQRKEIPVGFRMVRENVTQKKKKNSYSTFLNTCQPLLFIIFNFASSIKKR